MTIAAAYLVQEGVVFGADSTTTMTSNAGGVVQLLNHAQKVFEIGNCAQGRLALCTWGAASVGEVSHRSIVARLCDRITPSTRVADAVELLVALVAEERSRQGGTIRPFGYFFGGVDAETHLPHCHALNFSETDVSRRELEIGEAAFEGVPWFFERTCYGIDPRLPAMLVQALSNRIGDRVPELEQLFVESLNECLPRIASIGVRNLPIREAIDFVHTFLHVTVKAFKFRVGPPVCGGPIEIGFISADRPFRWARHKPFDAAIVEAEARR